MGSEMCIRDRYNLLMTKVYASAFVPINTLLSIVNKAKKAI